MWAIGNGESRTTIDIEKINGPKVGCNAIYREYDIDHIVCVDRRMMDEALQNSANKNSLLYTRKDWWHLYFNCKRTRIVPELPYAGSERWDEPFQWGSGPYSVLLSAKLTRNFEVNLIGFDLYSQTGKINNVYKGTENYDPVHKRAVDPRYWIHQISMVFKHYPKITFTIYQYPNWQLPKVWKYNNVMVDRLSSIAYNTYYD